MKRIDKLSPEHIAQMDPWADKWIAIGLSTERADWATFERAVAECYKFAGLAPPKRIIRVGSPYAAVTRGPIEALMLATGKAESELTETQKRAAIKEHWSKYLGGCLWASWLTRVSFFRDVVGLELPGDIWARSRAYEDAQKSVCWWWPHKEFVTVSDRPLEIHLEQVGPRGWGSHRLHCETGPAVHWPDGWGIWSWHGVRVPRHVIESPETLTTKEIKAQKNAEVRRVMRERFGHGRYLQETGAKVIDADHETARKGAAPRVLLEDDDGERWLVGTDGGTGRVYYMRVDPGVKTCRAAHESLCEFDESLILSKS